MEHDSVSETVENSFNQDSDTICVAPTIIIKPEIEDEKIKSIIFDSNSEIDFLLFKKILPASPDSVRTSPMESAFASDLLRHLRSEFGNLPSPTSMSSPVMVVFTKPSRFSFFSFDPGGASNDTDYTVRCSELVLDPQSTSVRVLVLFPLSTDLIVKSLFADLIFAKLPNHRIHIFDPGGSHTIDNFAVVRHLFDVALTTKKENELVFTDLISPTLLEDLVFVFDPGGSHMIGDYFANVHHPPFRFCGARSSLSLCSRSLFLVAFMFLEMKEW